MKLCDTGERREFDTGAVRDIAEGKGRCDLLPIDVVSGIFAGDWVLIQISEFLRTGRTGELYNAIDVFASMAFPDKWTAMLEVSKHYEDGCTKYGERNWEKGIPLHSYIDSTIRHYFKYRRGDDDERHDRAVLWNLMCAIWTIKHRPEMVDIEFWEGAENGNDND